MSRVGVSGFDPARLRAVRQARRVEAGGAVGVWTQEHVAGLVGVKRTYYLLWESGQRTPSPDALAALADTLGVATHELTSIDPAVATLRQLRELAGLTQAQVAETLGMSTSWYAGVERGTRTLDAATARRLADTLGIDDPDRLVD